MDRLHPRGSHPGLRWGEGGLGGGGGLGERMGCDMVVDFFIREWTKCILITVAN